MVIERMGYGYRDGGYFFLKVWLHFPGIPVLPDEPDLDRFRQIMRRAVFLDRDGVINQLRVRRGRPCPPATVEEVEIIPGVCEACTVLRHHGWLLIVVTNQPDVARGIQRAERVEEIHSFLRCRLPLDDIRVCYHDDGDGCSCRKPKPGLILGAARDWQVDLRRSFVVGDRWRDIEAGHRAGCRTVFIDHHDLDRQFTSPDFVAESLLGALGHILNWRERC